jgi:hypothetical protein
VDRPAPGDRCHEERLPVTARAWVKPTFEGRTIAQVANDRDRVADLLAKDMGHLSITRRRQAHTIITGTIDEAVRAAKLAKHNLHGIELKDNGRAVERSDFVFPSHQQITYAAEASGIVVWLMRVAACGSKRPLPSTARISVVRVFCGLPGRRRGTGARSFR